MTFLVEASLVRMDSHNDVSTASAVEVANRVVRGQELCCIATLGAEIGICPVYFAVPRPARICFVSHSGSTQARHLAGNPTRVAVAIYASSQPHSDERIEGLQIAADLAQLTQEDRDVCRSAYLQRYPFYAEYIDDVDSAEVGMTLYALDVRRVKVTSTGMFGDDCTPVLGSIPR
jgi:uncharacterized protein YhbP (UPF0306 family)